jgi:hypothetical protein
VIILRKGKTRPLPEIRETLQEALARARDLSESRGDAWCVISGRSKRDGRNVFGVMQMSGFGLPPGWVVEEVVSPSSPLIELEPPEKTSTNGF